MILIELTCFSWFMSAYLKYLVVFIIILNKYNYQKLLNSISIQI